MGCSAAGGGRAGAGEAASSCGTGWVSSFLSSWEGRGVGGGGANANRDTRQERTAGNEDGQWRLASYFVQNFHFTSLIHLSGLNSRNLKKSKKAALSSDN